MNTNTKPIWQSKRFVSAVAVVIAMLIVVLVPDFQAMEGELQSSLTEIALFLIGGYTITDTASILVVLRKLAELTPTKTDDQLLEAFSKKA